MIQGDIPDHIRYRGTNSTRKITLIWSGPHLLCLVDAELEKLDAELEGPRFENQSWRTFERIHRKRLNRERTIRICIIIALAFALLIFLLILTSYSS